MPYKLLLADDSVTIQRVIELTFADEDVQVLAVGDGKKAMASIQADRPDIVLADVGMPEHDGYEVAAFIKSHPELAHIPVLLLTGAFEPVDEARARAVGCDGVLVKPFEPQMVINRVKDLLAGRRPAGVWTVTAPSPSAQASSGRSDSAQPGASAPSAVPAAGSLEDYFDRLDAAFASMDGATPSAGSAPAARSEHPAVDMNPPHQLPHTPAGPSAVLDAIADWDPDLTGDPRRPALLEPPPIELDPTRDFPPSVVSRPPAPYAPVPPPAASVDSPSRPLPEAAPREPVPQAVPPETPEAPAPPPAVPAPHVSRPAEPAPAVHLPTLAEAFATLLSVEQNRLVSPSALAPPPDALVEDIVQRVIQRMGDRAVRETVTEVAERLVREEIARIKSA
ncbi:MAG: response regulator [Acidobacteriota bacterium]|nr:response regulator [Acidobacteriota bacterium]